MVSRGRGRPDQKGGIRYPLESRSGGKKAGGVDKCKAGEDLTFAEQMERKAERAGAEHYKKRED